ncbi:alpha/beta fold hydrolase [Priestia flexa]|uniref:alpha/beta fold hydrolase n=1 Tax=Priestia flexa TaxID=86664 RepID=UPI0023D95816|nr:alpha/beta fold hydrolase [Priestia flexa]
MVKARSEASSLRIFILLLSIILLVAFCWYIFSSQTKRASSSGEIPVLFIHGYLGSQNSLGTMIKRFEENNWGQKSAYCIVRSDGTVQWKQKGKLAGQLPMVHVVFKKADASLEEQTKWVGRIIDDLKKMYHISSVDLLGHSMGGLTATAVSLERPKDVHKLVTLGSPLKGLDYGELMEMYPHAKNYQASEGARDLVFHSAALRDMHAKKEGFAKHIDVFSGAGDIGDGTDGVVTIESAYGLDSFTEHIHFHTFHESHSNLHESNEVDEAVYQFLKRD